MQVFIVLVLMFTGILDFSERDFSSVAVIQFQITALSFKVSYRNKQWRRWF